MKEISIGEFARRSRLSLKALRLYGERGVLVPSRVDQASGYRYYDTAQLDDARLVVMLRQLQLPLAAVKELLARDPADAATRIAEHWRDAEAAHDARRDLADYLVSRLRGKRSVMYEVATQEMPERSLLCLKRCVDEQGQWAFGKEFIATQVLATHRGLMYRVGSGAGAVALSGVRSRSHFSPGFPCGPLHCVTMAGCSVSSPRRIEPCVRFSRTRLTDAVHRRHSA